VLHRDLKPENVLLMHRVGGALDLRVCDFGEALLLPPPRGNYREGGSAAEAAEAEAAREAEEAALVGLVGTRGYMAPEVCHPCGLGRSR